VLSDPVGMEAIQNCQHIMELVVTDTIPVSEEKRRMLPKLRVLSVADMFAKAMQIMTNGGSLGMYKDSLKVSEF